MKPGLRNGHNPGACNVNTEFQSDLPESTCKKSCTDCPLKPDSLCFAMWNLSTFLLVEGEESLTMLTTSAL